jgi:hypothetical protein
VCTLSARIWCAIVIVRHLPHSIDAWYATVFFWKSLEMHYAAAAAAINVVAAAED